MPDLMLEFGLKEHTDENGNPVDNPVEHVPVLVRMKQPPGQKPSGKAFCSPEGWRDPDQSGKPLYKIQFDPNSPQHWGQLMQMLRNDVLECDDAIAGCCRCPNPVKTGG